MPSLQCYSPAFSAQTVNTQSQTITISEFQKMYACLGKIPLLLKIMTMIMIETQLKITCHPPRSLEMQALLLQYTSIRRCTVQQQFTNCKTILYLCPRKPRQYQDNQQLPRPQSLGKTFPPNHHYHLDHNIIFFPIIL